MTTDNPLDDLMLSLLAGVRTQAIAASDKFSDQPALVAAAEAVKTGKLAEFERALVRPLFQVVDGLLYQELPGNHRAQFLFRQSKFVEMQFRAMVEELDGRACCADRTRTILRALTQQVMAGVPIVFDYTQEYTFHLPMKVFRKAEDIVGFFDALMELYYGNSRHYISMQSTLRQAAAEAEPPKPAGTKAA